MIKAICSLATIGTTLCFLANPDNSLAQDNQPSPMSPPAISAPIKSYEGFKPVKAKPPQKIDLKQAEALMPASDKPTTKTGMIVYNACNKLSAESKKGYSYLEGALIQKDWFSAPTEYIERQAERDNQGTYYLMFKKLDASAKQFKAVWPTNKKAADKTIKKFEVDSKFAVCVTYSEYQMEGDGASLYIVNFHNLED